MANVKCPKCKSMNIEVIGKDKKGFSLGKAIVGGVLVPVVGAAAGFLGKNGKYDLICKDCGHRYQKK